MGIITVRRRTPSGNGWGRAKTSCPLTRQELERRLRDRGTETEDKIQGRMAVAQRELTRAFRYDYVVLNDEVDLAVKRIHTIIDAGKMRYSRMETLVMEVLGHA